MVQKADWIAVDWGTSHLRAWAMDAGATVLDRVSSDRGMAGLSPEEFEPELLGLVAPWLPDSGRVPAIVCGMAGARQGWVDVPYVTSPCEAPDLAQAARPEVTDPRLDVRILPGVSQTSPPDVMHGVETRIAGYLAANPEFDGVLCLPGAHTKWVHVSAREIVSFRTFMTGELFALLCGHSVLRQSVGGDGWDAEAFAQAVSDAMSHPQRVSARLFSLHAGSLLEGTDAAIGRARLSGLLLGLEIAGARDYWLGREIVLIGAPNLTAQYRSALTAQGAEVRETDDADIVLAGLTAAWRIGSK